MPIKTITPRMSKALRDGAPLRFFGDVWLDYQNDVVDSQSDFQASVLASNMDFTTNPGRARLAIQQAAFDINQKTGTSLLDTNWSAAFISYYGYPYQRFYLNPGRELSKVTLKVKNNAGAASSCSIRIFNQDPAIFLSGFADGFLNTFWFWYFRWNYPWPGMVYSDTKVIANGYDAELLFTFNPIALAAGYYWLVVDIPDGEVYYNSSDVYAPGGLNRIKTPYVQTGGVPVFNASIDAQAGDMYFALELSGFNGAGGRFKTKIMDLEEVPGDTGSFQCLYDLPLGTSKQIDLYGSVNADMSSPVTHTDIDDGFILPAGIRYWQADVWLWPDADLDATPQFDMLEVLFPKRRMLLTERDKPLRNCDDAFSDYSALLSPLKFSMSSIDPMERVSTGGQASCELVDPTGEVVRKMVSDSPLMNYRAALYLGADIPGFTPNDLLRFFIGTVSFVGYKPKYRKDSASLSLKFKNAILELKRRIPKPIQTGLVSLDGIAIDIDRYHVMDAKLELMRGAGAGDIPARYIDVRSFLSGKTSIGDADLPPAGIFVRRSDAAGLSDNRIKTPEELHGPLNELCYISDGFIVPAEDGRITFIKYDKTAAWEEVWADEKIVYEDGVNAVPIEDIAELDLGYDSRLFNAAAMGNGWNGSSDDSWTAFSEGGIYAFVDSASAEERAPGKAIYLSVLEGNLRAASKWLGPQSGYNGQTIAMALTKRYVNRYKDPPVILKGVVVPLSQFMRPLGGVICIWSEEFVKFKRRGIALSEYIRFMIISKDVDRARGKMIFDLMELT